MSNGMTISERFRLWRCQQFHHRHTGWVWHSDTRTTDYTCRKCGCRWTWHEGVPW